MGTATRKPNDKLQMAAISRLFSSTVIKELARSGDSPLFRTLIRESLLDTSLNRDERISEVFDTAFSLLKKTRNRDEYVYKSAITNNILLGRHSLNTASMLTEFRVGECKADLVLLNGSSVAYEIKSERDRLDRLPLQVETYRKVFEYVYVVAGANHIQKVLESVPKDVGVLELSNRFQLSTKREASGGLTNLDLGVMFTSLRLSESKNIIKSLGGELPDVPNTRLFEELRKHFLELKPQEAHRAMVKELKRSRSLESLVTLTKRLPPSLTALVFSASLSTTDCERLLSVLDRPLDEA